MSALTPDPLGGDVTDSSVDEPSGPQSLNRYAYALNNPTTLTDPLGLNVADFLPGYGCSNPYDVSCGSGGGWGWPIGPIFPPIALPTGGAGTPRGGGGGAPTASNPDSGETGQEFRPRPVPCVNVSALAAALTIQLAAALRVPPSTISLTALPKGQGGAVDFSVSGLGVQSATNLPYVNQSPEIPVVHPGENSQFWFPAPKDAVPGLGRMVHVLWNQSVNPVTHQSSVGKMQVHVDIGNPLTETGGISLPGVTLHGLADVLFTRALSTVEGCSVKFQ